MKCYQLITLLILAIIPTAHVHAIKRIEEIIHLISSDRVKIALPQKNAYQFPYFQKALTSGMKETREKAIEIDLPTAELELFTKYLNLIATTKFENDKELQQSEKENRIPQLKNINEIILADFKLNSEKIAQCAPSLFHIADRCFIDQLAQPLMVFFAYVLQNYEEINFDAVDNSCDSFSSGFDALQKRDFPKLATNELFKRYLPLIPQLISSVLPRLQEKFLGIVPFETQQEISHKSSMCVCLSYDNQLNKLIITDPHTITILGEQKKSIFDTTVSTISTAKTALYDPVNQQLRIGTQQGIIKSFDNKFRWKITSTTLEKKAILALALHHKNIVAHAGNGASISCLNQSNNRIVVSQKVPFCPIYAINFLDNDLIFGTDRKLGFWDIEHEKTSERYFNESNAIKTITPYERKTFLETPGNVIKLFDTRCTNDSLTLTGHNRTILSVLALPNSHKIISGGYDKTVRIWDMRTQQSSQIIANNSAITCMAFDDNKKELFIGDFNGIVKKYGLSTDPVHLLNSYQKIISKNDNKTIGIGN